MGNEDATVMFTNGLWNDVSSAGINRYLMEISGGTVIQTAGLSTGSLFSIGTTTNTFEMSDGVGSTTSCSFDVTISDTQFPVIAIPKDTILCSSTGSATLNYSVGAADNCNATLLQASQGHGGTITYYNWAPGGVSTFDITPINSLVITSLQVYPIKASAGAANYTIRVYYKRGSRLGFETNASAWTLAGTTTFVSNPSFGALTTVNLTEDIAIPAGERYAIWVIGVVDSGNGTVGFNPSTPLISDANFTTSNHDSCYGNGAGDFGGTQNYRFVGNINYTLAPFLNVTQTAGLASGSTFTTGVTTNTFESTDGSGNTTTKSFTVTVAQQPSDRTIIANPAIITTNSSTNIEVPNSEIGMTYQLQDVTNANANVGTLIAGTGGTISLPTQNLPLTNSFRVVVSNAATPFCERILNTVIVKVGDVLLVETDAYFPTIQDAVNAAIAGNTIKPLLNRKLS